MPLKPGKPFGDLILGVWVISWNTPVLEDSAIGTQTSLYNKPRWTPSLSLPSAFMRPPACFSSVLNRVCLT